MRGETAVQTRHTHTSDPTMSGLRSDEVVPLRERYGANTFTKKKQPGFCRQLLHNCNDPIIRILIGALVCNMIFLFPHINWYESAGITAAILISAFVSTLSEHSGSKAFARLYEKLGDTEYTVIRDGIPQRIHIGEIVTYDLVSVGSGDMIPADGILVEGSLRIDESSLTGESRPIQKNARPLPFSRTIVTMDPADTSAVFRGSSVLSGEGKCIVTHVGDNTMYGALASALQEDDTPSPLKERLTALAKTISKIGYASAAFVALAYLFQAFFIASGMQLSVMLERIRDLSFVWRECLHAFTMAISIIVVAVPEGLPMMITVVLSSNMKKMMKNGILVRKLVGIETSGCLSVLFTDKTGTITSGNLQVTEVFSLAGTYDSRAKLQKSPSLYAELSRAANLCAGSLHGNATDKAIARFLDSAQTKETAQETIPFDSARKFSAARIGDVVYVRGAPEYILPYCHFLATPTQSHKPMAQTERQLIDETMQKAARDSRRVVLQAVCNAAYMESLRNNRLSAIAFTFQALYLIEDEIRPQVPEAVKSCQTAGIHVIMITGDNEITAAAIGQRTGIIKDGYQIYAPEDTIHENSLVLRGKDLAALSDDMVEALLPKIAVIARVTPTDKNRLVRIAKHAGHVVGMTGDGINDAPALRSADVGFAMGSGTDITREAGDIVITDDNFASITKAILFGRTIFESIRKFIVFQLIMNLSAVGVSMLGPLFHIPNPVTVIQMLWVNIIMDTLGSLAFAGEAPLSEYMTRQPIARNESILNGKMLRQILFSAAYTIALCMIFLTSDRTWYRYGHGNMVYFLTAFFALFIFCGICNAFTVRTSRINLLAHLQKNKCFLIIMPAVAIIQLIIIYFGGDIFRTTPLHIRELLVCAGFAMSILPLDAIRKRIWR